MDQRSSVDSWQLEALQRELQREVEAARRAHCRLERHLEELDQRVRKLDLHTGNVHSVIFMLLLVLTYLALTVAVANHLL